MKEVHESKVGNRDELMKDQVQSVDGASISKFSR